MLTDDDVVFLVGWEVGKKVLEAARFGGVAGEVVDEPRHRASLWTVRRVRRMLLISRKIMRLTRCPIRDLEASEGGCTALDARRAQRCDHPVEEREDLICDDLRRFRNKMNGEIEKTEVGRVIEVSEPAASLEVRSARSAINGERTATHGGL